MFKNLQIYEFSFSLFLSIVFLIKKTKDKTVYVKVKCYTRVDFEAAALKTQKNFFTWKKLWNIANIKDIEIPLAI
jgi:hypothetical protein